MSKTKFTAKDLLNCLKGIEEKVDSKFENEEVVAEPTKEKETEAKEDEQKFMDVPLADGETILSYDGELAAGTPIFVVGEDGEQMPAPEGTHELGGDLAGVSIIVDSEGVITEVVDEREDAQSSEENTEEAMSKQDVEEMISNAVAEAMKPVSELVDKFESITKENKQFRSEIEKLKDSPSEKTEVKKKFMRDDSLTPRQRRILAERKK